MDPLVLVLIVAGVACAFCWIASLITKDTSWVDRLWSIVPFVYVWIFAIAGTLAGVDATRLIVMAVLATLWGARLTFNFARKGGYTGMEDYRWAILRARMKPWQFQLFNLFFIVLYQNALLVLITLPAYIAYLHPAVFNGWDAAFAALFVAFLIGEFIADQQQWDFHRAKKAGGGSAVTRTSSSSRRSGGRSTRSARRRPWHPVSASGAARSTGRSSARSC
jgi:steroid 5-alpha reductase family enzyme